MHESEEKPPTHLDCFPILAYETFNDVLNSLNIAHVVCDGEADNQIAVLAKQWGCPVISNDGDMYIFDLPGGFVNFSDIDYNGCKQNGIETKLYSADNFQQETGFPKCLLPFAATILGNIYADIDFSVANEFFRRLGSKTNFSNISRNLKNAFDLLAKLQTVDNAVRLLQQCVDDKLKNPEANDLKVKINSALTVYSDINEFSCYDLAMYFDGEITPRHRRPLPDCVMDKIRTGILSGLAIDVTLRRVILKPTLEDLDLPPVQEITRPLRQIVYGLVCKSCPDLQIHSVIEIIRNKRNMSRVLVKPVFHLEGFGFLPTLEEIENQGRDYKIKFLSDMFSSQSGTLSRTSDGSTLFVLSLRYFIKNAIFPDKLSKLKIFVFCHVVLVGRKFMPRLQTIYEGFVNSTSSRYLSTFHIFLQCFHECLNMAYTMNALVGMPLQQPDPATVFDGKFMYNLFKYMDDEGEVERLVSDSLIDEESLQFYQHILQTVGTSL